MNQAPPPFCDPMRSHVLFSTETPEDAQKLVDIVSGNTVCDGLPKCTYKFLETPRKHVSFSYALEALKSGWMARLPHWSDDVRIVLQRPDENSKMTHPYLYVESRYGCVPWKETFVELLSECWEIAPYEPLHVEPSCCCCPDPEDAPDACDEETAPAE